MKARLAALKKKLAATQKAGPMSRLSETNMVEIVSKLKQMGLVDLIGTTDGRAFVTPEKLKAEIVENVNSYGYGRLSIAELSEVLLIDFSVVETYAKGLLANDSNGVKIINGQLVTTEYFDKLSRIKNNNTFS